MESLTEKCVTKCVTTDGGRLTPASFLCFFGVSKFESRLALFFIAPEICQMAGFRSFYYHIPFLSIFFADTIDYNKTVKAYLFL